MAPRFPLYVDLYDNNCIIFGGGHKAYTCAVALLQYGAKVTVISPTLCDELREMDRKSSIRYIPRRYYRGDCTSSYLCVAATDSDAVNISISDECKAKAVAVSVLSPAAYGTFSFPQVFADQDLAVSVECASDPELAEHVWEYVKQELPAVIRQYRQQTAQHK